MSDQPIMPSRRALVRSAAWTLPAVTVVSAAPAFAVSGAPWAITSNSWEGWPGGWRIESSTYYMNFTITVPEGVVVTAPTVTLQFGLNNEGNQTRAGLGHNVLGWTTHRFDEVGEWSGRFVFTAGDIVGPTTKELKFVLNSLIFIGGKAPIGTLTFAGGGQQPKTYDVLKNNVSGSIVSPTV